MAEVPKFPDEVYAVFDARGEVYFFTNLRSCPVMYDKSIRVAVYKISEQGTLKKEFLLEIGE